MDKQTRENLGGTVTKISVRYQRKMSDNEYGSVGGEFEVDMILTPISDPDTAIDALFEWVKAAAIRNLRPSFEAVKPKEPIAPAPAAQPAPQTPQQAPLPAPMPAPSQGAVAGAEKTLIVQADDTVQLKITDNGKKLLVFKAGPWKKHGITCWPEVAGTWSELGDWPAWQVAQPYFVSSFNIRQLVYSEKMGANGKMQPDKMVAFR